MSLLREGFKKIIEFSIKDLNQPPTPHNRKKRQVEGLIVMGVSGSRWWVAIVPGLTHPPPSTKEKKLV